MPEAWAVRASIAGVPSLLSCSCPGRLMMHARGPYESPLLFMMLVLFKLNLCRKSTKPGSLLWRFVAIRWLLT